MTGRSAYDQALPGSAGPVLRPFDAVAPEYDAAFTRTRLGRRLREAVWERFGASFGAGQRVLDLGCGTGEDAVWLARRGVRVLATDVATRMLEVAARKADAAGVSAAVRFERLDLADPDPTRFEPGAFDGALSSFGALNCVPDRRQVAKALARWVRPGGRVVLVVMGPCCPWEIAWHLAHGEVRTAFRRFRAGVEARVAREAGEASWLRVWYPAPRRLQREFGPDFRVRQTVGIGVALPPSALAAVVERRPRVLAFLGWLEARLASRFPGPWLCDHYLLALDRA